MKEGILILADIYIPSVKNEYNKTAKRLVTHQSNK